MAWSLEWLCGVVMVALSMVGRWWSCGLSVVVICKLAGLSFCKLRMKRGFAMVFCVSEISLVFCFWLCIPLEFYLPCGFCLFVEELLSKKRLIWGLAFVGLGYLQVFVGGYGQWWSGKAFAGLIRVLLLWKSMKRIQLWSHFAEISYGKAYKVEGERERKRVFHFFFFFVGERELH